MTNKKIIRPERTASEYYCPKNSTERHSPIEPPRGSLVSICFWCKVKIHRAHKMSSAWKETK